MDVRRIIITRILMTVVNMILVIIVLRNVVWRCVCSVKTVGPRRAALACTRLLDKVCDRCSVFYAVSIQPSPLSEKGAL